MPDHIVDSGFLLPHDFVVSEEEKTVQIYGTSDMHAKLF